MLSLVIASPEQPLFRGEVERVVLPGKQGEFEVLNNHIAIMALLGMGSVIAYPTKGNPVAFCISSGIAQVNHNHVSVMVDSAFEARQNEEKKLREKQAEYRSLLGKKTKSDYAVLMQRLAKLTAELNAIERIRNHRK